ncbi:MAG: hypothetical protein ACI8X5_001500, partial [Planctomycetota bacterium]
HHNSPARRRPVAGGRALLFCHAFCSAQPI